MEVVTISGYEDVPENDEESLLKALAHQPLSVAIEASGRDFQFYSGVSRLLLLGQLNVHLIFLLNASSNITNEANLVFAGSIQWSLWN